MLSKELTGIDLTDEVRKELIDYYKWVVNLATFILTVSISLVGLFARGVEHKCFLVFGWALLALCVFLNWLLIKRLVTMPIVAAVPQQAEGLIHRIFKKTIGNMKVYGFIQNWAFLLGTLMVGIAMVLNLS